MAFSDVVMFERILRIFIFLIYLFDTVFARKEQHNKGIDMRKVRADQPIKMERFAMPS